MIKPTVKNEDGKKYFNTDGRELVIVKKDDRLVYLVYEDKNLVDIEIENEKELPISTRCVGKVSNIAKDINAAYILLPDKNKAFLKNAPADLKCEQSVAVEITRASSKGKLQSVSLIDCDIEHRSDLSIIEYGKRPFVKMLEKYEFDRVLTDDINLYDTLIKYCSDNNVIDLSKIILYNDSMVALNVLYSVSSALKEATSKIVWLKSGANIVIEETGAFTVIDVNSAKKDSKNFNSYLDINEEAADEIFRQMNLRNMSGIILVDFINMRSDENKILLDRLKELSKNQKSPTKVVDITLLGIAEITRKKEGVGLSEIFK